MKIITSSTDIPSAAGNHGTNGKPRMELNTQDVSACIRKPPLLIRMPAPQKSSGSKKAKKQIKKTLPGLEVSTSKRPPSKRMKKVARILQPDEHMLLEALSLQTSAYQRKFKIDNSLPKVTYQQTTEEVIFLNEDKFSPVSTAPVTTVVKQENGINHPSSSDIGNKNINLCYCDQELKIEADYEDNSLHELQFIEAYQELHRTSSSVEYVPISNIKVEDSENSSAEVKGQVGLMDTSDSVSANCCHREVVHVTNCQSSRQLHET
ncbi:hypothetical protein LSH36_526g01093 [Paralvinella palmiformis]|uniref:Uncharacterized protein n=1 Tax=Paralvinella palmiformis TaxID=53620 RepID=A0AAD9J8Q4_9ANNE|nr:hypothetical protein LSH36_526g01093 [Paralvinella palmiformis]